MEKKIKVVIVGALGKMGMETIKAVLQDQDVELAGLVDIRARGEKISDLIPMLKSELVLENDLKNVLAVVKPDVVVDFTNPQVVYENLIIALNQGVTCVVGTTGLKDDEINHLEKMALEKETGLAIIPNFAIGAVLMMEFAREAAKHLPNVEILEIHHDQKMDAPSGTAIKTAQMIVENRKEKPPEKDQEFEKIPGVRGGDMDGIKIHSIRLPGFVAHQEVIFGGVGQSLTIRHDTIDRICFMPGVLLAIKKMQDQRGLIYGLEKLL